jgi:mannose-6-phosphate isomerase-like protein (cupin superfamily)
VPSYRVLALDDVEAVPGPASLAWRPLRAELGLNAFGVSSFVASEAGEDVIEPHTEMDGRGHQELYVVMRGAARFTLDGESFEAPAGTLISVPDPRVHRHGVATEPVTEVLAFGGDAVFQPAGDEWIWRVRHLLPDQVEPARALADAGLAEQPDSPGLWYVQALVAAAEQKPERAREWLNKAVEREPRLLDEARAEPLLADVARGPAA